MKIYKQDELLNITGDMVLIYGDTGVGKSVTALQTAEEPIFYIMAEGKDVKKLLLSAADTRVSPFAKANIKVHFGFYEGWDDLIEMFAYPDNFTLYKTIIVDSISHLMAICLPDEILQESFDAMGDDKKNKKDLAMRVKMSKEGYGTLSGQMFRFTQLATNLTHMGKVVVLIARSESAPTFNRALRGAPTLKGQEYGKHLPGFLDFIGYVEPRIENGIRVYPPLVSFEGDGAYQTRWSGLTPEGGVYQRVLHIQKILEAARGTLPGKGVVKNG